jgi:hypothetical protein
MLYLIGQFNVYKLRICESQEVRGFFQGLCQTFKVQLRSMKNNKEEIKRKLEAYEDLLQRDEEFLI